MNKFIKKRIEKFKQQSLFNKILDIFLLLLIVLLIFPSTRKELMTYTSKVRMYITSVDEKKEGKSSLEGKFSLVVENKKGKEFDLGDFDDRPVFINYWATWCPPCRAEMPALQKLYNNYKGEVHFLFVTREPFSKTQPFIEDNDYSIPVYQLKSRPQGTLTYQALPTTLLLSKNDSLVFKKRGAMNWNSNKVHSILDEAITGTR